MADERNRVTYADVLAMRDDEVLVREYQDSPKGPVLVSQRIERRSEPQGE
jgi:hypothetical protein